jgi:hypothetical protein
LRETLNGEVLKMSLKDTAHRTQMGQFAHLTVQKLKLELSKRGAKTGGRKAELIECLEAYDRNQNFQSFEVQLPSESPMPNWPDVHLFRSVTATHRDIMPQIHQTQIDQYVLYRQCADQKQNQVKTSSIKKSSKEKSRVHIQSLIFKVQHFNTK